MFFSMNKSDTRMIECRKIGH